MIAGYCSSNFIDAEKALLQFRDKITSTRGFEAVQNPNYALGLVEARLFGLYNYLGNSNAADSFFLSSVENFSRYRGATAGTNAIPSKPDLLQVVDRLDAQLEVRWKR